MKKKYSRPIINKVKLVTKNAILGVCHSSPNVFPKDPEIGCQLPAGCSDPPTGPING